MSRYYDCLNVSGTSQYPTLTFKIFCSKAHGTKPITLTNSDPIQCPQITCQLNCWFSESEMTLLHSKLSFNIIDDVDEEALAKSAIILMDYKVQWKDYILGEKNDIVLKLYPSETIFDLDKFFIGTFSNMPITYLDINFKFVQVFDYSSTLFYCIGSPTKAPYFQLLNSKDISNTSFKVHSQDRVIWVISKIICKECAFFQKMLQKEWIDNKDKDGKPNHIEMKTWSDKVLIAIILHLYTGWLPDTPVPSEVYEKLNIEESEFLFDYDSWLELYETSNMIELSALAFFSALEAKKSFSKKIDDSIKKFLLQKAP